jgi:hypothetical protein
MIVESIVRLNYYLLQETRFYLTSNIRGERLKAPFMAKWADYCIFEVSYNTARTHIDQVKAYIDDGGDTLTTPILIDRATVVSQIGRGNLFITIVKGSNGQYQKGAKVETIRVNNQLFLKTVTDSTPKDNLGNLPEF